MGTAIGGTDVVGKGQHHFRIAVVILQGYFRDGTVFGSGEIYHIVVNGGLGPVQMLHKRTDAALIAHIIPAVFLSLRLDTLVREFNSQTRIQECLLSEPLFQNVIIIDQGLKDLTVGLKDDLRTVLIGLPDDGHTLGHVTTGEFHLVNFSLSGHPDFQPFGQSIYNRGADAVKTAGNLITAAAEFTAGMEHCKYHFQGRFSGLRLNACGDASAVVLNGDDITLTNLHLNVITVTRHGLVDGIVHDLIHQVVKTRRGLGTNIHTGALSDCFQSFQHLNLFGTVCLLDFL